MYNKDFKKTFTKKGKKIRKKIKKWQIENSEKSEISEKLFWVFFFPRFWFCPTVNIENSDLKVSEKKFRDFPDFRDFRGFRVFDLASNMLVFVFQVGLFTFLMECFTLTFHEMKLHFISPVIKSNVNKISL